MANYSRVLLSESTDGRPIPIAATATPGTDIHATAANGIDEVYLWASNVTAAAAMLTIEWGGVTNPDDHIVHAVEIPANSPPIPILTGQVLQNGLTVAAFSGTADAINVTGFVNRIA